MGQQANPDKAGHRRTIIGFHRHAIAARLQHHFAARRAIAAGIIIRQDDVAGRITDIHDRVAGAAPLGLDPDIGRGRNGEQGHIFIALQNQGHLFHRGSRCGHVRCRLGSANPLAIRPNTATQPILRQGGHGKAKRRSRQ